MKINFELDTNTLTLTTANPEWLGVLRAMVTYQLVPREEPFETSGGATEPEPEAAPPAAKKKVKRHRRTKAQIAADRAREAEGGLEVLVDGHTVEGFERDDAPEPQIFK